MESPLGPTLANVFLAYHEQNWLDSCPLKYRPLYYRRFVDDIFALFKSSDHLKRFQSYLNNKISFLVDVNVIREQGKFVISVCWKPTFSGVYTHFDSFLPDTYTIGMIYTLVNRYFQIWSSWSMFHQQLILLREILQKNGYPENFIDRCFKLFLNNSYPQIKSSCSRKEATAISPSLFRNYITAN